MSSPPREVAANLIRLRMDSLGWTLAQLAREAGVSTATVRKLLRGHSERYRPRTPTRVARALRWPSDALIRLLEGEEPTRVLPPPDEELDAQLARRIGGRYMRDVCLRSGAVWRIEAGEPEIQMTAGKWTVRQIR